MDGMNKTGNATIRWFAAVVAIAATAYLAYVIVPLGGKQTDAREAAYQASYAESHAEGHAVGYDAGYAAANRSGYDDGYAEADQRGYQEVYPTALDEGRLEGYDSGYSAGFAEGQALGYEPGYADGETEGFQRGYDKARLIGMEEGRVLGVSTGVGLHNPTYWEMREFLMNDWTETTVYDLDDNNCMDYATLVVNAAADQGIRAAIVLIGYQPLRGVEPIGHAIVAFDTTDEGLQFVEPQTDWPVYPELGKRYRDSVPVVPGFSYPPSLPNDVIETIDIIW